MARIEYERKLIALVRRMTRAGLGFSTIEYELKRMGHKPKDIKKAIEVYMDTIDVFGI